eukprot:6214844-Pleurochrysis_carterae.AAC.1
MEAKRLAKKQQLNKIIIIGEEGIAASDAAVYLCVLIRLKYDKKMRNTSDTNDAIWKHVADDYNEQAARRNFPNLPRSAASLQSTLLFFWKQTLRSSKSLQLSVFLLPFACRCTHALFEAHHYQNNDMTVPTFMINGGNADNLGESNLLAVNTKNKMKRIRSDDTDTDKENINGNVGEARINHGGDGGGGGGDGVDFGEDVEESTGGRGSIDGGGGGGGGGCGDCSKHVGQNAGGNTGGGGTGIASKKVSDTSLRGGFEDKGAAYDGLGLGEDFMSAVVNGGNRNDNSNDDSFVGTFLGNEADEPQEPDEHDNTDDGSDELGEPDTSDEPVASSTTIGGKKMGFGYGHRQQDGCIDDSCNDLGYHDTDEAKVEKEVWETAIDETRKKTTATSTRPLNIGGGLGGEDKYRARPPPGSSKKDTAAVSDIGRAAAAMEGFTVTYKEQCMMDRAASQQDAAAARALIKEEILQQKEIAQGCKQM